MQAFSIYLHIPFCTHRCGYCDFNTYAGIEDLIPDYVSALCQEVRLAGEAAGERLPVYTIFFGGGTPSLLPPAQIERILQALDRSFSILAGSEISLEANPGTLSLPYLRSLSGLGINRLSLGMQAAQPEALRLLERQHGYPEVVHSVAWARQAGFHNLNLDLIFGLPYQDLEGWRQSLEYGLLLEPEHLSLYALTLEHGTPLAHWVARGLLSEPDADLAADMYEWSSERLAQAGFYQYEISNFAHLNGEGGSWACRHNLQYWRSLPYLGFGAGAHGFAAGTRTANILSPKAYVERCLALSQPDPGARTAFPITPATVSAQPVKRKSAMGEFMMMGLRLTVEGVSHAEFHRRFGVQLEEVYEREVEELLALKLLERAGVGGDILRLTPGGRLLGNQAFIRFI
jgi:oxygen-independent coproporphyrinogen-3 oxidase